MILTHATRGSGTTIERIIIRISLQSESRLWFLPLAKLDANERHLAAQQTRHVQLVANIDKPKSRFLFYEHRFRLHLVEGVFNPADLTAAFRAGFATVAHPHRHLPETLASDGGGEIVVNMIDFDFEIDRVRLALDYFGVLGVRWSNIGYYCIWMGPR